MTTPTITFPGLCYIVRVTYNDSEGQPGETLHGPYTFEDARDVAVDRDSLGDTEVQDIEILFVNLPTDT